MRALVVVGFLIASRLLASAQDYSAFTNTVHSLKDSVQFEVFKKKNTIPFVVEDSVAFIFYGKATSVAWMGDFNGWGYDKTFISTGVNVRNTSLWILKAKFPKNARLDYKIVLNSDTYILDPANPHQQWSGVGGGSPNSELRMPEWKESVEQHVKQVEHGTVKSDILINSKILNYQVTYSIYLPTGFEKAGTLPVIYVTDGYEYLHPQLGNMTTVLDNLIAEKKIKPIAAVFVDHREPINRSNNRRMNELAMNSQYLDFFTNELMPEIERNFPVSKLASERGIMGTSMGGLAATYFAFTKPGVFGLVGIQSPAFWTKPQIYQLCTNQVAPSVKISMTSGVINDTSKESRKMKEVLEANSCIYHYREVNEGHSWGNWRNLIDDVLIDLFGI
ncbi:MAG: esterase family protein [Cytophagales bacterium]|jgi:enterochelin esterase-like enzyme|nr:esterase family protein [Cytophagales bacterium]MCA6389051.1 esterase family protein [Cytophagales bacterium]MCA6392876.1 esterase family protein [Cytophagales bacterium]MCA6394566.1 esterase family protein [Cytophagales bacterium]MCA6400204.1 esterase family protein [Cytophagales bacterium]